MGWGPPWLPEQG